MHLTSRKARVEFAKQAGETALHTLFFVYFLVHYIALFPYILFVEVTLGSLLFIDLLMLALLIYLYSQGVFSGDVSATLLLLTKMLLP